MIEVQPEVRPAVATKEQTGQRRFTLRQWMLLPLIGILPLIAIAGLSELIARKVYVESPPTSHPCLVLNDPSTGVRAIPNSVCMQKTLESGWVEFRFNSCGHRAGMECGRKSPGVYRIVLMGSSLSEGWTVPREKSFAALLPAMLSKDTGQNVELYNEGMEWGSPHSSDLRFNDVLAMKPDLILWPVTPWDIYNVDLTVPYPVTTTKANGGTPRPAGGKLAKIRHIWAELSMAKLTDYLSHHSTAFFMVQHWLYKSDSIYLGLSESVRDQWTDSLVDHPGAEWQAKLEQFGGYTADMIARAKAAGVPFVVVVLPRHAQAVMIASGDWPPNLDPYSFGNQIKPFIEKDGGVYIDILPDFRNLPHIHSGFHPVDPHLNIAGHAMVAGVLEHALTSGPVPALSVKPTASAVAEGGK
jgi:hypothetical protein